MLQTIKQLLPALLIGPFIIFPINLLFFLFQLPFMPDETGMGSMFSAMLLLSVSQLLPGYGFALLYWLPAYLVLRMFGKESLKTILIASTLPGLILLLLPEKSLLFIAVMLLYFLGIGALCWTIVTRPSAIRLFRSKSRDVSD